uniref:Uncharacterized protein n=1 Tax=Geospiza parvula TaxID=87175 RepID=A0A8U8B005_GEOPR
MFREKLKGEGPENAQILPKITKICPKITKIEHEITQNSQISVQNHPKSPKITQNNFTGFLAVFGEKLKGADPEDVIMGAFKVLDPDGKGSIKKSFLEELLTTQCDRFTPEEIKNMWAAFPPDVAGTWITRTFVTSSPTARTRRASRDPKIPKFSPKNPGILPQTTPGLSPKIREFTPKNSGIITKNREFCPKIPWGYPQKSGNLLQKNLGIIPKNSGIFPKNPGIYLKKNQQFGSKKSPGIIHKNLGIYFKKCGNYPQKFRNFPQKCGN